MKFKLKEITTSYYWNKIDHNFWRIQTHHLNDRNEHVVTDNKGKFKI